MTGDKNSFLELVDGKHHLKKTHAYYHQVQAQMKLCKTLYCDFVVWSERDKTIERILPDQEFIGSAMNKSMEFFKYVLLPELLGKYYTKLPSTTDSVVVEQEEEASAQRVWCYCRKEEHGQMIQCESGHCEIDWFHTDCLKISCVPKGKWLCPDCRKKAAANCKGKRTMSKD